MFLVALHSCLRADFVHAGGVALDQTAADDVCHMSEDVVTRCDARILPPSRLSHTLSCNLASLS